MAFSRTYPRTYDRLGLWSEPSGRLGIRGKVGVRRQSRDGTARGLQSGPRVSDRSPAREQLQEHAQTACVRARVRASGVWGVWGVCEGER
jgi:hypothetical protein